MRIIIMWGIGRQVTSINIKQALVLFSITAVKSKLATEDKLIYTESRTLNCWAEKKFWKWEFLYFLRDSVHLD